MQEKPIMPPNPKRYAIKGVHPESDSEWLEYDQKTMIIHTFETMDAARTFMEELPEIDHGLGMYYIWDFETDKEVERYNLDPYQVDLAIYEPFSPTECPWYLKGVPRDNGNRYTPGKYALTAFFTEDSIEEFQEWCFRHGGQLKVLGTTKLKDYPYAET
jgi:hypothetical protein